MILCENDDDNNKISNLTDEMIISLDRLKKARFSDQNIPSPTDINYAVAAKIKLPNLQFINYDKEPIKLKEINTGRTVIISGKWKQTEHPYLTGGPLFGKYVLSMLVFHWGDKSKYGSFHTVQNIRRAIEIQAVHFKINYLNLNEAAKFDDGVVIISYIYEVRFQMNIVLEPILIALDEIRKPDSEIYIEPFQLNKIVTSFEKDYFTYNGKLKFKKDYYFKNVIWIIPCQFFYVSFYQIQRFSCLLSKELLPIKKTPRYLPDTILKPTLFLVNPSKDKLVTTCLPMPFYKDLVNICD